MKFAEFNIKGMTCDHCAQTIAGKFSGKEGILSKEIKYSSGTGKFEYDPEKITKKDIRTIINSTGHYQVEGEVDHHEIVEPLKVETVRSKNNPDQYDLIIIGGGSAAFSAAIKADSLGLSTLMVNEGLDFGGTCVNVGCVPSKILIRAAETAYHSSHSNFEGIKPKGVDINFALIIKDKKKLVATLQKKKYLNVVKDFKNLTMLKGWAKFKDQNTILVNNKDEYKALKFLIATGSTTQVPDINGLNQVRYLTNVSLFDLEEQPESMIILGGGYIALEIAQAYQRLGTKVTLLQRSEQVLSKLSSDIADELTVHLKEEGMQIYTGVHFINVSEDSEKVRVTIVHKGEQKVLEAEKILVSTGTKPNTDKLGLQNLGLELENDGHVLVNNKMETNLRNIYAAGDVVNTPSYVYTAAFEGKIAVANAFAGGEYEADYSSLPWVIFTDPQVAGVGMDEVQAQKTGLPFELSKVELKDVPRAIAANDTRGFIKLIRNTETDKLIGARVVAPEGGELVQLLSMSIKHGITIKELAESFYPYLTLGEGIKLAAITFGKDISELSCCAS